MMTNIMVPDFKDGCTVVPYTSNILQMMLVNHLGPCIPEVNVTSLAQL